VSSANEAVSAVESRLQDLGIALPEVAAPVAAYIPAVVSGDYVYTSGQLPFINGELPATGKVVNAMAAVKSQIGDLDRVSRIVKVVGFVASDPSFTGQPGVINGASELLGQVFGEAGAHARSAVGVAVLPLDAPVEVEIIAEFI
jgi:enamine deaminase RidA (YjgF/YER057c/UK114 family)